MSKRVLSLILALVCCFVLLAGCGGGGDETKSPGGKHPALENYERPDLGGVKLTMYMPANSDIETEGSWLNKTIEGLLDFELEIIELDSWGNQYLTMMAEGRVPDLSWNNMFTNDYNEFGTDGAYINIYDYLDMMPNVQAFLEDPKNAGHIARYLVEEGVLFALPITSEGDTDPYTFLYRKDIFEANNLTFPTNQKEFLETLRTLKKLYPDSNPFIMRQMTGNITGATAFGHLWGASHLNMSNCNTIFILDENGKYFMAQQSEPYKEMAQFMHDLIEEGLMNKSSMTVDTAGWQEAFASDRSFITYDKVDRLPVLNRTGQSLKAQFQMVAAAPFNFGTYAGTTDVVTTSRAAGIGAGTINTFAIGDNENLESTIAYVDWLYSEEGRQVTNWGIEGESWEYDADGNMKFIDSFLDTNNGLGSAGLNTVYMCGYKMLEPTKAAMSESDKESLDLALQYTGKSPAQHRLSYTEEEQLLYDSFATAAYNYAQAEWSKFVLGQRDFSEWDKVQQELKAGYKFDELLKIHEAALERLLKENGVA